MGVKKNLEEGLEHLVELVHHHHQGNGDKGKGNGDRKEEFLYNPEDPDNPSPIPLDMGVKAAKKKIPYENEDDALFLIAHNNKLDTSQYLPGIGYQINRYYQGQEKGYIADQLCSLLDRILPSDKKLQFFPDISHLDKKEREKILDEKENIIKAAVGILAIIALDNGVVYKKSGDFEDAFTYVDKRFHELYQKLYQEEDQEKHITHVQIANGLRGLMKSGYATQGRLNGSKLAIIGTSEFDKVFEEIGVRTLYIITKNPTSR